MKHLKKFKTISEYELFKVGDEYFPPNVSLIETGEVLYNLFNINREKH